MFVPPRLRQALARYKQVWDTAAKKNDKVSPRDKK